MSLIASTVVLERLLLAVHECGEEEIPCSVMVAAAHGHQCWGTGTFSGLAPKPSAM